MSASSKNVEPMLLTAGPLTCLLDGLTLNHIGWSGMPLVRMIYAAVRDAAWGTVDPSAENFVARQEGDWFRLDFDLLYRAAEIDMSAHVSMSGENSGELVVVFDGVANRAFDYARIGLCVLLPWRTYCGKPYAAALDGIEREGVIPPEIAKQYFLDGCYTPSIPPFTRFEARPAPGVLIGMQFEGDEFEMEDQRNWTDSTLKIYSTPLHLGNLHHAASGHRIRQVVRIRASLERPVASNEPDAMVRLEVGPRSGLAIPPVGTTWPRAALPSDDTRSLEQAPNLSHLRLDIDLAASENLVVPRSLPAAIELALWADAASIGRLRDVLAALGGMTIARIIVNDAGADVTPPDLILSARAIATAAGCEAPTGGGSDFWFAEINRSGYDFSEIDFLSFTISPQLHVFDNESIMESAAIQGLVIEAAKERVASRKVAVSPITLIARDAAKERARQAHETDPRHGDDFLIAWTAASLASAIAAGPLSLTYFDLFGSNGILTPDKQGSWSPTPVLELLRAIAQRTGQAHVPLVSSLPDAVRGFAMGSGHDLTLLLVNCEARTRKVELSGLAAPPVSQRRFSAGKLSRPAACDAAGQSGTHLAELAGHEVLLLECTGKP